MTVYVFWRVSCRGRGYKQRGKKETQEKCGFTEAKRRKCLKEGVGSSVEDRKISRKVTDGLDEQTFMGGSFANPFRVSLGKNGE